MRRFQIRQIARNRLLPQDSGIEHFLHSLIVGAGKEAVNHGRRAAIIVPCDGENTKIDNIAKTAEKMGFIFGVSEVFSLIRELFR